MSPECERTRSRCTAMPWNGCASLQRPGFAGGRLPEADHLATGGAQLWAHACGGGDAAVGHVDRAVGSGSEAGGEEQLANAKVRALTVLADAHHIPGRVLGAQPRGLEFGGIEAPSLPKPQPCTLVRPRAQTLA